MYLYYIAIDSTSVYHCVLYVNCVATVGVQLVIQTPLIINFVIIPVAVCIASSVGIYVYRWSKSGFHQNQ